MVKLASSIFLCTSKNKNMPKACLSKEKNHKPQGPMLGKIIECVSLTNVALVTVSSAGFWENSSALLEHYSD